MMHKTKLFSASVRRFKGLLPLCMLTALLFMTACFPELAHLQSVHLRKETAKHLTLPSFMTRQNITTDEFNITAWERSFDRDSSDVSIYLSGDGPTGASDQHPIDNPTPINPVALHLATRDMSPNIIYLPRPCQYTQEEITGVCHPILWTRARYSERIVHALDQAIDDIVRRYDFRNIHLVGYDGGGGLAIILAARRRDIKTIRTVAGVLDHEVRSKDTKTSMLDQSLNPVDFALKVKHIPQHHFVGEWDRNTPISVLDSYAMKISSQGPAPCSKATIVRVATHEEGWIEQWPMLLDAPLDCSVDHSPHRL